MSAPAQTAATEPAAPAERAEETQDAGPVAAQETPGTSLTHRLFRGHDPFEEFSADPFSSGGTHRVFGSGFGRVMQGLENLSEAILGVRPVLPREAPPLPEATCYSVQSATMTSFVGADGKIHTEQFASSDVGHRERNIRETHQAYHNSDSGMSKRALEQHLGQRAIKTVQQRGGTDTPQDKDMLSGMDNTAEAKESFKKDFEDAAQYLPEHQTFKSTFFADFGAADTPPLRGAGRWRASALEASKEGGA